MSEPPSAPYGGTPSPEQPTYPPVSAPGYPPGSGYQPTYQAPAAPSYPPPPPYYSGPPAPGVPGPDGPAVAPKKSRVGKIIGIVAAVVVVLCLGGGAIVFFAAKGTVDKARNTRVSAPASVAGRPKSTDPQVVNGMASALSSVQSEVTNTTSSIAAGYGEPNGGNFVVVVAVSGLVPNPGAKVDEEIAGVKNSDSSLTMGTPTTVDAGPLGGVAKCAQLQAQDASHAVCVWADTGSVGVVIFYDKVVADVRPDFLTIRGQVEQQG